MVRLILRGFQCWRLDPIDLDLAAGECLSLSGPSGAGKTLLLRALADLDPHRGQMFVDGVEHRQLSGPEWRRRVALVPAESHWWAELVGAHFARREPDLLVELGLDPGCLEWPVSRLSSGERQRLALARQLLQEPEVLLLDEPTANLDRDNRLRIEQCVAAYRAARQAAVIWVSHDTEQRRRIGDRWALLEEHRLQPEPAP